MSFTTDKWFTYLTITLSVPKMSTMYLLSTLAIYISLTEVPFWTAFEWNQRFCEVSDCVKLTRHHFQIAPLPWADDIIKHFSVVVQWFGCGLVASNIRGLRYESSHRQTLHWTFVYCQLNRTDENKEKEVGNGPFNKTFFSPNRPKKALVSDHFSESSSSNQVDPFHLFYALLEYLRLTLIKLIDNIYSLYLQHSYQRLPHIPKETWTVVYLYLDTIFAIGLWKQLK